MAKKSNINEENHEIIDRTKESSFFADHFQFVRINDAFSLKANQLDHFDVNKQMQDNTKKDMSIEALESKKITMTLSGFKQLLSAVEEFKNNLKKSGIPL